MKILELSPSLAPGGAERFTVDLCNELAETNEVTLLVMRNYRNSHFYEKDVSDKVHLILENGKLTKWSKILQLIIVLIYIIKIKPDVVHAHTVGINWLILPSLLYPKAKYFFTIHNVAAKECTTKIGFIVRKFLYKRNVIPISISETCRKTFYDYFKFSCDHVIFNGCRDIHLSKDAESAIMEINSYKKNADTKVYINVARIMPQKNQQLLIKAFNEFVRKGENAILLIIGDYKRFPLAKKELDCLIDNDCIHFLGTKNNVPDYLCASDYFCLSSLWEGLPISLLEAGLSGCFPISTPAGGVVDIILNDTWGFLSKDFSKEAYLAVLEKSAHFTYDKDRLERQYKDNFLMKKCASNYIRLFEKYK